MLFISDIAGTELKIYMRLIVSLEEQVFRYIIAYEGVGWRKCLKRILAYLSCTKFIMKLTCLSGKQNHVS